MLALARRRLLPLAGLAGLLMAGIACEWPRDPESTLKHVRGGVLRAGAIHAPPWVVVDPAAGPPRGREAELVRALAQQLGAEVRWRYGGETRLMQGLRDFELDLVVGGITTDSPYTTEVGFTRPYTSSAEGEHVFAVPPGENGWLATVERFLRGPEAERITREAAP